MHTSSNKWRGHRFGSWVLFPSHVKSNSSSSSSDAPRVQSSCTFFAKLSLINLIPPLVRVASGDNHARWGPVRDEASLQRSVHSNFNPHTHTHIHTHGHTQVLLSVVQMDESSPAATGDSNPDQYAIEQESGDWLISLRFAWTRLLFHLQPEKLSELLLWSCLSGQMSCWAPRLQL